MEQDPDSPPTFWFQPPLATNRRRTPPIDPVVLIILLPILALLFLFFFLPPFLSHTSHILKPGSVKSTWDSLNIFLVIFAILCGVLARRNDDVSSTGDVAVQANSFVAESRNNVQSSGQWVGFSDQKVVTGGLRRSSSSYPDLRQESLWENGENRNRYFDDFGVDMHSSPVSRYYHNLSRRIERERENMYRSTPVSSEFLQRSRPSEADQGEFSDVKEIVVDTFEVSPNVPKLIQEQPTVTPPPPPPPPPPSATSGNSKRHSFRSVGRNVKVEPPIKPEFVELDELRSYYPPPPPPPPPPPFVPSKEVKLQRSHHKHKKLERKVSDATKEIATAISSLYNQKKKKSKRKLRNSSSSSDSSPPSVHSIRSRDMEAPLQSLTQTPPPPPPPPPPTMFRNLFKKGGKHKRIHSVPATVSPSVPPPPPPPPPSSIFNNLFKAGTKSKRFNSPSTAPPPLPPPPPSSIMNSLFKNGTKSKRFNSISAASSPPPPPPPPPPIYTVPVKSKQLSQRKSQAPPSPPISEPRYRRSTSNGKPPLPTKPSSYYEREDFLPSGSQSPLIPLPPPPPPFKMLDMKFELRGDFVRIRSTHSSVCSSPDRDDVDLSSTVIDGGDSIGPSSGAGPIFFPSPDVNAKADSFISRLKDEWRMEKINAVKD